MALNCKNCLLPESVPGANIDGNGICEPCRIFAKRDMAKETEERAAKEKDLENTLTHCRGEGDYDCILSFSGGKDSIYLLHKLKQDYNLRVLAYTSNFDVPLITQANIKKAIAKLNVDHINYTPPLDFYKKFIRYLLQHQSEQGAVHTLCYFWLDLREGDFIKLAIEKNIPLILTGYAPGQPDPERLLYEMPQQRICEEDWTPKALFENGFFDSSDLTRFYNPKRYPANTRFPRVLAPFHAWEYSQADVMERVVSLGLVPNKIFANPIFTNFTLNWLFMYSDIQNLGYNPYFPEFSQLIREGRAKRTQWKALIPIVNFMIQKKVLMGHYVKKSLKWLELNAEDCKIDPVL